MQTPMSKLVILYGIGGLSDVGRHAVHVALAECEEFQKVTVLTMYPELLQETNWKCGCPQPHHITNGDRQRLEIVHVQDWSNPELRTFFSNAAAVISCTGNRQPFLGGWHAHEANKLVIEAMQEHRIERVVTCTSAGVEEDWPPFEFDPVPKYAMSCIFMTCGRKAYRDLTNMEKAYRASNDLDYLLVRPAGLGEDVLPVGTWTVQRRKYDDVVGINMAKLDLARFMVQEAINPTYHKTAVVVGGQLKST